jgi:hypothetical protein
MAAFKPVRKTDYSMHLSDLQTFSSRAKEIKLFGLDADEHMAE